MICKSGRRRLRRGRRARWDGPGTPPRIRGGRPGGRRVEVQVWVAVAPRFAAAVEVVVGHTAELAAPGGDRQYGRVPKARLVERAAHQLLIPDLSSMPTTIHGLHGVDLRRISPDHHRAAGLSGHLRCRGSPSRQPNRFRLIQHTAGPRTATRRLALESAFEFSERFGVKLAAVRSWSMRRPAAAVTIPFLIIGMRSKLPNGGNWRVWSTTTINVTLRWMPHASS